MQKVISVVVPTLANGQDYKLDEIVELDEYFEDGYKVVSITPNTPSGTNSYDCCFLIVLGKTSN